MVGLAQKQDGFLGLESVCGDDGLGITVSYWESRDLIIAWGKHGEHVIAKQHGRQEFYLWYQLRIAKVEQTRSFDISRLAVWLNIDAMGAEHFHELARFIHFTDDITATNKFAFNIKLRYCWPI